MVVITQRNEPLHSNVIFMIFFVESLLMRVLVDSWASTTHAYRVFLSS